MGARTCVLVAALVLAPVVVRAQPEGEPTEPDAQAGEVIKDPRAARNWVAAGKELVTKGDQLARRGKLDDATVQWTNAATAFEKAITFGEDLAVYADLASVEEKLGKLDLAATHYRVVTKAAGLKPDVVKRASARFDDLTTKVGLVTLVVKPEGATITITGATVGTAPMAEPLVLMPGSYTVSVAADGHQPKDVELKVDAGSENERTVELEAIQIIVAPPPPAPQAEPEVPALPPPPSKLPLLVGGSATVGLAAVALVSGIVAVSKHGTFTAPGTTTPERADARSSGETFAVITDVALVGALAGAGFTAYWYLTRYRPAEARYKAQLAVTPWGQLEAGGVAVAGTF